MTVLLLFIILVLSSIAASSIPAETCSKPKDSGKCRDFNIKWYYDADHGRCSRFWYGGCEGNANRFESQNECKSTCVEPVGQDASRPSHDPCALLQCGPNSVCKVENAQGVCSCLPQYVGSPPECRRPECLNSVNCPIDHSCEHWKCIKIPAATTTTTTTTTTTVETPLVPLDPCTAQPSLCGPYSTCRNVGGYPSCSCLSNYIGQPPNCQQLECVNNTDCSSDKACVRNKCRDPCTNFCGEFARCRVHNHNPICICPEGYVGDETHRCRLKATAVPNVHPKCTDDQFFANCTLIVLAHYCTRTEYYAKYCCRSCTLAGQLRAAYGEQ